MKKQWVEIRLDDVGEYADAAAALLADFGCAGVTLVDQQLDTFEPPAPDAFAGSGPVLGYLEAEQDLDSLRQQVLTALAPLCKLLPAMAAGLAVRVVAMEDWAEGWKQHFPPLYIGDKLLVLPTWEEVPPAVEGEILRLDPGMAFGTGGHATTRLCLEALVELMPLGHGVERVLDVGTGSGILAIAAVRLGAREVLACDIDPGACAVAADNCRLNGVEAQVRVTGQPLAELATGFDLVLANILAEENVRLANELVSRVRPGGWLVLSGILREKEALVTAGFADLGLAGPQIRRSEDWSCLLYRRSA